jgi:phenylacetate-coenzyme A ligase PaaK-like adenylate-forming protein
MVHPEVIELGNGLREMVFTNLNNFAMPLLRYRTGDVGDLQVHGDQFTIKSLKGRIHDFVEIGASKLPSHYIMDILNRRGDVDDFQFVMRKGSRPELRVVTKKGAAVDDISATLKKIFDENVDLRFVNQNQLELSGWRDKYRYVVQKAEI